jgi:hypothetical protein
MMRTWRLLGLSALTALLLVTRASAGGGQTDGVIPQKDAVTKEHLEALEKRLLEEFRKIADTFKAQDKRLNNLEVNDADTRLKLSDAQIKIKTLEARVDQLRLDVETLQKRLPPGSISKYPPDDKAPLDEIRAQLRQIEQALNRLQATTNRTAFFPPTPRTGRIVFTNLHPETLLFVLNNTARRVEPGQTMTFNEQLAGTFTYEVVSPTTGTRGVQTRTLEPGETYTLTARP